MILNENDYDIISDICFKSDYPGYTPLIIEAPNGDNNWDNNKLYAHISPKYLSRYNNKYNSNILWHYYNKSIIEGTRICKLLNLSKDYYPVEDSTLRILKYPAGSTTAPHTDFDLFTLSLFRNIKDTFKYLDKSEPELLKFAKQNSDGIHFGEIMTEINGCQATKHKVISCDEIQNSMVFFVVPNHYSKLPSGISVGDWINERKIRSRKLV